MPIVWEQIFPSPLETLPSPGFVPALAGSPFRIVSPAHSFDMTQICIPHQSIIYAMTIASMCLFLFILNLAIATGAGLYELRIVLPLWFIPQPGGGYAVDTTAMQRTDVGRRFWGMVTTLPLSLLTIINLVYSLTLDAHLNLWWLFGSLLILTERLATFTFFIPKAIVLQSDDSLSANDKSRLAARWLRLNYVRNAVTAIGLLLCVKAFLSLAI